MVHPVARSANTVTKENILPRFLWYFPFRTLCIPVPVYNPFNSVDDSFYEKTTLISDISQSSSAPFKSSLHLSSKLLFDDSNSWKLFARPPSPTIKFSLPAYINLVYSKISKRAMEIVQQLKPELQIDSWNCPIQSTYIIFQKWLWFRIVKLGNFPVAFRLTQIFIFILPPYW